MIAHLMQRILDYVNLFFEAVFDSLNIALLLSQRKLSHGLKQSVFYWNFI